LARIAHALQHLAHRLEAYSVRSHLSGVATCRQTVEALLAPRSTAWQRMATIRFPGRRHLSGRSHLSPDGGGFTRAAVHRLAANGYDSIPRRSHLGPSRHKDSSHWRGWRYRGTKQLALYGKNLRKTIGFAALASESERRGPDSNNLQIPWETSTTTPRATRNPTRAHCGDSHLT
jgi:predicted DNA-binding transcriptional regulator AlpA